jgi:hypothetical protein
MADPPADDIVDNLEIEPQGRPDSADALKCVDMIFPVGFRCIDPLQPSSPARRKLAIIETRSR